MSLNDVRVLHAWLRGRLELASSRFDAARSWFAVLDAPPTVLGTPAANSSRQQILSVSLHSSSASTAAPGLEDTSEAALDATRNGAVSDHVTPAATAADAAVAAICGPLSGLCTDSEVRPPLTSATAAHRSAAGAWHS